MSGRFFGSRAQGAIIPEDGVTHPEDPSVIADSDEKTFEATPEERRLLEAQPASTGRQSREDLRERLPVTVRMVATVSRP
jgi:hypothetical protein